MKEATRIRLQAELKDAIEHLNQQIAVIADPNVPAPVSAECAKAARESITSIRKLAMALGKGAGNGNA